MSCTTVEPSIGLASVRLPLVLWETRHRCVCFAQGSTLEPCRSALLIARWLSMFFDKLGRGKQCFRCIHTQVYMIPLRNVEIWTVSHAEQKTRRQQKFPVKFDETSSTSCRRALLPTGLEISVTSILALQSKISRQNTACSREFEYVNIVFFVSGCATRVTNQTYRQP